MSFNPFIISRLIYDCANSSFILISAYIKIHLSTQIFHIFDACGAENTSEIENI